MTASRRGAVAGLAQFAGQQTEDNGVAAPTLERHVGAQHALTAESASLGDALRSMAIYGHIRTTRRCRDRRPPIAQVAALHGWPRLGRGPLESARSRLLPAPNRTRRSAATRRPGRSRRRTARPERTRTSRRAAPPARPRADGGAPLSPCVAPSLRSAEITDR